MPVSIPSITWLTAGWVSAFRLERMLAERQASARPLLTSSKSPARVYVSSQSDAQEDISDEIRLH